MLENVRERYRKWSKKADERNIKEWQKHPRLNNWMTFIYASCLSGFATILLARALLGYIQYHPILPIICSAAMYGTVIWVLMYTTKIARKAFPKQS